MFGNIFKTLGFGNAKVDARLHNATVVQGGALSGDVYITGSDSATTIDELYLKVVTQFKKENDDHESTHDCVLAQHKLFDRFQVNANDQKSIPFQIPIPFETPVTTLGYQKVFLQTTLETSAIFDPSDTDYIQVQPHPHLQRMVGAIQNLGFSLHKVDCEYNRKFGGQYPFVQEFEFKPHGEFRGRMNELEAYFKPHPHGINVTFQLDKRGWSQVFGMNESYAQLQLNVQDLQGNSLERNLRNYLYQRLG
ncbi:MAG TPA: sporulation protein [Pyrinomonadaceae bacterium]|nr:sporulation protein [Pyrinomonadaceae bacterium]